LTYPRILSLNFVAYPNIVQQFDGSMEFIYVCVRTGVPAYVCVCVFASSLTEA